MSSEIATLFQRLRSSVGQSRPDLFSDGRPVLIYGAGNVGRDVCHLLTQRGVAVVGFLDRAAQPGATVGGIPIYLPNANSVDLELLRSSHVVIGIHNAFVEMPPIERMLVELGCHKVISFLELHDAYPAELGDRFWLTAREFYLSAEAHCQSTHDLLSDDASKALFDSVLRFRFTKDFTLLPAPDTLHQYFDPSLPPWESPLRFIDCGAYHGDTLEQLSKSGLAVEAVAAFEPDTANFVQMSKYVESQREILPRQLFLYPCGVDASTRQVRFLSSHGASSHLDEHGDTVVQCVSIDQALHGFAPNLIKMDIEGAELAALWGAHRTISEHLPGLAICVYHRPEHLWQIPGLVARWYGDRARYYLRSHGFNGFDLVLYVVRS